MTLISLILALALEQLRPLGNRNRVWLLFTRYANHLERNLNAGAERHGVLAWLAAIVPALLLSLLLFYSLKAMSPVLALAFNVLVLYLTMGFRHFSSAFSEISQALAEGREYDARVALANWTGLPTAELSVEEISRLAIEQGVVDSYRHVFGTMFWFVVLPGPSGALLYRLCSMLNQKWGSRNADEDPFGLFAARFAAWLDWIPVRLTAVSFAIMGDFEDAIYCWRSQARTWGNYANGILLASAAGALGVKLGDPLRQDYSVKYRPELGLGDEADPSFLKSAVGLVWRSALLWLAVTLLISVVSHMG
ncbi:CobD/CbiB family protein [Chromobacterium vaccinii]|uniref:Cobalamin biosynthesis protein CobD n=3 Tax=Chromobacteriaceae TaxID=1499392 RepID=A0A1D9LKI1_9NEIS|nr:MULTISPECIES: CobD/CbiB family protein [Chromobacteriaceae]AOZ51714.1 threonine-phosphate decarboxylase [Chromobacterium vaccinii]AVG15995.1 threonine-phosphate decarboxylase [Chromobacterium vaccinii]ERE18985.1 threonine-phosphate decarboxylase [Pseudogulbenkiania ferrooxidans EGD-HP2]MCD4486571.1 CobD/CbiB family protein [Chromobacterium vaccinii]MCD4500624.1 CobD/CbiB family protein [Chromobacterium vaccinii]